jgi:hypothetical protein
MLLRWGNHAGARFLLTFVGYQINGISGHSFLRWRYSYPHLCLLPIESYGKKNENSKPFATFLDAVNVASISIISYLL